MHRFNSRIAAATGTRHIELLGELNHAGLQIYSEIADITDVIIHIAMRTSAHEVYAKVVALVHAHYFSIWPLILAKLQAIAKRSHTAQAKSIAKHFPLHVVKQLAPPIQEDLGQVLLMTKTPWVIERSKQLQEPAFADLPEAEQRKIFQELLLPLLTKSQIEDIIFGGNPSRAADRFARMTKLADPILIANTVSQGLARGDDRQQIARTLRPILDGNKASAMRVVRTEGARVANAANMHAYQELGELVIGYQLHAVLDANSRPWHAARNGKMYFKNPTAGQTGLDEMPFPPFEPSNPSARPAGTPELALNCRCWISPIFADATTGEPAIDLTNAQGRIIPDPLTYDQWFANADEQQRRTAVGAKRYAAMQEMLTRKPDYLDFVSPKTGDLLSIDYLKYETIKHHQQRRLQLKKMFADRRISKVRGVLTGRT